MKFFAITLLALATVASARKLDLVLDGYKPGTGLLAKQIAPLLLSGQSLLNYRTVPLAQAQTVAVQAAPTISTVAYRGPAVQTYQVAAPVQTVAVQAAPAVQTYQVAAPVQTVAYQAVQAAPVQYAAAASAPITAAVQTQYNLQVVDVPTRGAVAPTQTVVIGPSVQPLDFEFQSQSAPISVRQSHIPGTPNPPQSSSHQDEPDILRQEVVKPIIHEVTEAVQPFRKITQEVRPVQETINQIVTRGQQVQQLQAVQPVVAQAAQVQTVAVQAAPAVQTVAVQPVQTVAVQAAPALQTVSVAAPVETITVERAPAVETASVEYVEQPAISTISTASVAPVVETVEAPALASGLQYQSLPVTAKITRY